MIVTPREFDAWLRGLPNDDAISWISQPRAYAHDESAYDAQYLNEPAALDAGRGVIEALRPFEPDRSGPAVEIGCGTGLMSLGLVESGAYPLTLITDPSAEFVRITRRKIEKAALDAGQSRFAVLLAEDVARLPGQSVSLIVMRSTLHHILDVERFVREAAGVLRPGGVLAIWEPCAEVYLLMASMAQFWPLVAESARSPLTEGQMASVTLFLDTMRFYARRDVDKSNAEDKHAFRPDEILRMGRAAGLEMDFLANASFEQFGLPRERWSPYFSFTNFFREYLRYCMGFDDGLIASFDRHMQPHCQFVEHLCMCGAPPNAHGIFVGKKQRAVG